VYCLGLLELGVWYGGLGGCGGGGWGWGEGGVYVVGWEGVRWEGAWEWECGSGVWECGVGRNVGWECGSSCGSEVGVW